MNLEQKVIELEARVSELEKQVAAATTTSFNTQRAAEIMQETQKKRVLKRGVAY